MTRLGTSTHRFAPHRTRAALYAGRVARCRTRAATSALAVLVLAGCGGNPQPAAGPTASPSPSPATASSPDSAPPVAPPAVRGATEDGAVPADRSGPLTADALPTAAVLGAGWKPFVDPGGHEAGFSGNDSWVRERDPSDVLAGLPPIGCATAVTPSAPLPAPVYALEGTYDGPSEDSAVGLALEFASPAEAERFLAVVTGMLRACGDSSNSAVLRIRVVSATPTALVDTRRDPETPERLATEVLVRSQLRVGLLFVDTRAGAPPMPTDGLQASILAALRTVGAAR